MSEYTDLCILSVFCIVFTVFLSSFHIYLCVFFFLVKALANVLFEKSIMWNKGKKKTWARIDCLLIENHKFVKKQKKRKGTIGWVKVCFYKKKIQKKKYKGRGYAFISLRVFRESQVGDLPFRLKWRQLHESKGRKWPKHKRRAVYQERDKLRG
jgi:hypothetical protein